MEIFLFHRSFTEDIKPDKNLTGGYKLPSGFSRRIKKLSTMLFYIIKSFKTLFAPLALSGVFLTDKTALKQSLIYMYHA
jgi:hypothetical protein